MSTYSTNLKIEEIGTGEQAGTWGVTTNDNFVNVFEEAIVGRVTVSFSDADVTLTATNSVASQSFRNVYLNCTGTNAASRNLIVPTINKNYVVQNNTTGGFDIVVKTTAGTGITVPNGRTCTVYADGTNVIQAFDYLPSLNVPTLNITTLDATNIEVTNIKAKDGTASATIADSTGVMTIGSSVLTTTDINGGTIDGTTIGGASAAAGTFTSLTDSGNLTFTGTGNRILGDFSNATAANRVSIQSSTTDGSTAVNLIPNGTSVVSSMIAFANSTLTNASFGQLRAEGSVDVRLVSSFLGSGTYLPLTMYTGGSERLRIDTSGNVGIGTSSPAVRLVAETTGNTEVRISTSANSIGQTNTLRFSSTAAASSYAGGGAYIQSIQGSGVDNYSLAFGTALSSVSATEKMRITNTGVVLIGTATTFNCTKVLSTGSYGVYRSAIGTTASPVTDIALGYVQSDDQVYANISFVNSVSSNPATWMTFNVTSTSSSTPYEAMSIQSNGLVEIGNNPSTTATRLDVYSGNIAGVVDIARFGVGGNGGTGRGTGIIIGAGGSANSVDVAKIIGYQNANAATATSAALAFQVANPSAVLTEVMRLTNGGQVGIGTNAPSYTLQVNGSAFISTSLSGGGSGGFNIVATGTFNDGSGHSVGSYQNQYGTIFINATGGNTAIPFWCNGGGGVGYAWQWIIPGNSAVQGTSGTSTFTVAGTGGNTFTLDFGSGSGVVTLTRTAGSGSFTYWVQILGA